MSEPQGGETSVEESLQTFLDAISDSETYQQFVDAQARLEADDEAMELLQAYEQKQQQLQANEFDQSRMSELQDLQTEVSNTEVIQRHQSAEADLIELLTETNDVISEKIGEEFAQSLGGGCC